MGESNWSLNLNMNSLSSHLTDHFVVLANVSRAEVDEDVDDEHDVHCDGGWNGMEGKEGRMIRQMYIFTQEVYDDDGVAGAVLTAFAVVRLVEQEGGHVRREDGRVDHQHQDDPVPQGLY